MVLDLHAPIKIIQERRICFPFMSDTTKCDIECRNIMRTMMTKGNDIKVMMQWKALNRIIKKKIREQCISQKY